VVPAAQKRSTGGQPTSATASQAAEPPYDHGSPTQQFSDGDAPPSPRPARRRRRGRRVRGRRGGHEFTLPGFAAVIGADARAEATERQFVVLAEDDLVASPVTYSGTHDREFLGIPATGEHLEFTSISIVRFADDKISGAWVVVDTVGPLQ
jgi:predicted ester cyclase